MQDMVAASINEQVGFFDFGTANLFGVGRDDREGRELWPLDGRSRSKLARVLPA